MVKKTQIKNGRVTLADVADAAGVSMMTVSRAVNNKTGVGGSTRKKILSLVEEMGYVPNSLARGLVTQETKAVGLIVPDNTNPFFGQIARGVEDEAYRQDYSIFLVNTVEDELREERAFNTLLQKNIDGLISCSSRLSNKALEAHIKEFSSVVLLNRECKCDSLRNVTQINIDDKGGAQTAVNYLIDKGYRHIAHIGGPPNSISAKRRREGYLHALNEAGYANNSFPVYQIDAIPTYEGGREAMAALLKNNAHIDAVYTFNDLVAIGALQVCKENGKRIPEDIAIIGVDGTFIGTIVSPKLTTLKIDLFETGKLIMQTLLRNIEETNLPGSILLKPELVIRESA